VLVISKVLRMQHLNISSHPGVQYVQRAQTFCSTLTDIVAISASESGLAVARYPEVKSLAAALLVVVARALAAHAQQRGTHVRGVPVVANIAALIKKKHESNLMQPVKHK
jgi:hypothetical protein